MTTTEPLTQTTSATPGPATLAVIQCNSGANTQANQAQLSALIAKAAGQGAKLLLLPEMCLNMDGRQYAAMAEDASLLEWSSAQAREHGVWLIMGAMPQPSPDGDPRVRSACLVFNDQGEQVARYDKIHLFDVDVGDRQGQYRESERFAPGHEWVVVETPYGKVGLSICFDLRFPEQFQALVNAGAEILVVPAAFTHRTGAAHWEVLLRARAIETQCIVMAANQCGWHDESRQTWGHSMIIDAWGDCLGTLAEAPDVLVAEVDLAEISARRRAMPLKR